MTDPSSPRVAATSPKPAHNNSWGWLMDYAEALGGTSGPELERLANQWFDDNPNAPTNGTAWKSWRRLRQRQP